jgi:hypothetical protein
LDDAGTVPFELPGGHHLLIRAMQEDDVDGLRLLYESLPADDRYSRFFAQVHPTADFVRSWLHRCCRHGFGVVTVTDGDTPQLVAEAAYVLLPNGDGEYALTVGRDLRGWLSPYLLDVLARAAAARGWRTSRPNS